MRDDGMSYGNKIEQPTCLLFLKMGQEDSAVLGLPGCIPEQCSCVFQHQDHNRQKNPIIFCANIVKAV